jgi:hypothetical protein
MYFRGNQAALEEKLPEFVAVRVNEASPQAFLEELARAIQRHPDIQYIYLSSHGNREGLRFTPNGAPADFTKIAEVLRRLSRHVGLLTLIFGSCKSMDGNECRGAFQGVAQRVVGFSKQASCSDVTDLLAGSLAGEMELWERLHALNVYRCEEFNQRPNKTLDQAFELIRTTMREMADKAQAHQPNEARYVALGQIVFSCTWDFNKKQWICVQAM